MSRRPRFSRSLERHLRGREWLLLVALAGGAAGSACHQFHACYDRVCEPVGAIDTAGSPAGGRGIGASGAPGSGASRGSVLPGLGGEGQGAEPLLAGAGAGAAGGTFDCVAPHADCDESTLTGCEANLLTDLENCGVCGTRCIGACVQGECHAFETLVDDIHPSAQGGIALTATDLFALSNHFDHKLVRWSSIGGGQVVFNRGLEFGEIVAGVDRIYLLGGGPSDLVSSVAFSGGTVVSEGIDAKTAVMVNGSFYAVDSNYVPYRIASSSRRVDLPLSTPLIGDHGVRLSTNGSDLVLVSDTNGAASETYSVVYIPDTPSDEASPWHVLASGDGTPRQVRVGFRSVYLDVVPPGAGDVTDEVLLEHELREVTFDGATRLIAKLSGIFDFELVSGRVYVSLQRPRSRYALRIISLDDPSLALEVQTSSALSSLTFAEPYFYFGDTVRGTLSRLPAWLE